MSQRRRRGAAAIAAPLFFLAVFVRADDCDYAASAQRRATATGAATASPVSEAEIVAKLETPAGAEFHFVVADGGMLRVVDELTGVTYGFAVQHQKGEPDVVVFDQYLIELHPSGGGETLTSFDRSFSTAPLEKAVTDEGYNFELLELRREKVAESEEAVSEESTLCCVYCGGVTVCGSFVRACGIPCCSGTCCSGDGES